MALTWSTQSASSSFLSNDLAPGWKYDVFLSFTGVDTRRGFVSHLFRELCERQGIMTFYDERELERGTSISPELLSAIEASHTAIVVLSPKYAHSKWCLDELSNIVRCMGARKSILPVFYETDPSDVGNQRASFAEAFTEHEKKFIGTKDEKKVTQWKADLKEVSKISGWHSKNFKCETELIDDIVKCVWRKVQATFTLLDSSQKLVGSDSALEHLSLLLAHDANDVRFIGITGMGGVGKTTLAKLVYDKIFHHFEVHCFLENVREVSVTEPTLVRFQKQLLSPILKEDIGNVSDQQWGTIYTKKCLCNKKVLLVLDDVDKVTQLQVLAGNKDWFGKGSRIIITTRNQRLLVEHDVTLCQNVELLNDAEALELFSLHAFRKDQPEEDFLELSKHFLEYARGLPLVLKTLGSSLYARGQDAWNSVRDNLRNIPNTTVFDSLKVSYDGLENMEKRIFLDVACFHKGKDTMEVLQMLDNSFGISSRIMIYVLIERSLVYEGYGNEIGMHDLIQEMARTIVCEESEDPGLRSRLWLSDDIFHVLMTNTGSRAIEAISLRPPEKEYVRQWNCKAFSKMHGLRFLEFNNLIFSSGPEFLPCSLRIINWSHYPSKFLPTSFRPYLLTELNMRESNLVRLWEGKMDLPKLKYLSLASSCKLINTPDFSGSPNLEVLVFSCCLKLVEIHPSVAALKRLKDLILDFCGNIKSLPSKLEMDSLRYLILWGCSNVKKIPEFGEQMKNVIEIDLASTAIEKIPSSIGHLVGLEKLGLNDCINLLNLPRAICNLKSLKYLDMRDCRNLLNLPRAICNLKSLRRLNVHGCSKIDKLPGDMDHLEALDCGGTMIRQPFVSMKNLEELSSDRGQLHLLELGNSRSNPPCWGWVSSSRTRLCSLTALSLRDCELREGDIPDDIGCLSFLGRLDLGGNNFVSLPESIRRLSKLWFLKLDRCKSLQELPPLPSTSHLRVDVNDCTSLKRLTNASKLSSRFTNLYDFEFTCRNCIALFQDEARINTILSWIPRLVARWGSWRDLVLPGSEIPKWFSNQSVGNSVNVKLPPPSCTDWLGIAFCLVLQDPFQNLANPPYRFDIDHFGYTLDVYVGSLLSEHLFLFYHPRKQCDEEQFLFKTHALFYCHRETTQWHVEEQYADFNSVKKCGARLVYKQDLEELNQTLKIMKRTHDYSDGEASSGPVSASFNDTEQIHKRHCY